MLLNIAFDTKKYGEIFMKSQDIAIVGVLLAAGAIVRYLSLVIPGPIVSNLVIAFYCLAIILVAPTFREVVGIGFVAGIVCALISHSIFPPANLVSEPVGALVCLLVYRLMKNRLPGSAAAATLLGTLASGFTFVAVAMVMVAPAILTKYATIGAFALTIVPIVVLTACANAVIVQLLYLPASRVLGRAVSFVLSGSAGERLPDAGDDKTIITLDGVTYTYPGADRPALKNLSLAMRRGEILLISGPTAAGKTTLCHAMAGILQHQVGGNLDGTILLNGRPLTAYAGMAELSRYIGVVFDDADAQLMFTTVEEEISSGLVNRGYTGDALERRIEDVMRATGITDLRTRAPHTLSGGQKQRVALAATLALDTDVLILDEATSELDQNGVKQVAALLSDMRAQGKTVVLVDHNIAQFVPVADRVLRMENGSIIPKPELDVTAGESTAEGRPVATPPPAAAPPAGSAISISDLRFAYGTMPALNGVDLTINPGEFVAIVGDNGSGKTTLVKHFNGLLHPSGGEVSVMGRNTADTPVTELVRHAGLVFQNPDMMLFEDTVGDEVAFGMRNINGGYAAPEIGRVLDLVGLGEKYAVFPRHLSRGERQRLAVACILAVQPEVIILDEPTTGLDEAESAQIMALLQSLQQNGHTIVMVTHNMGIVRDYAQRVIVMEAGSIVSDSASRMGVGA
jgi:energy-coupling factor transporter ATP-binding protein EcfA2